MTASGRMSELSTRRLRADDAADVIAAADLLCRGGLVAFPTDTVYGLGTTVWDAPAVARIFAAKQRPSEKAIPVLLADFDGAGALVDDLPAGLVELAARFWPGALTLVAVARQTVPEIVTAGTGTVALRVPDLPVTLALLRRTGPLAVSSANRSGLESPVSAAEVLVQLDGRIDAVLDGGRCPGGQPSTVVDLTQSPPQVVRCGPISEQAIRMVLAGQ